MVHANIGDGRETVLEQALVILTDLFLAGDGNALPRTIVESLPNQDAVIIGITHGDACKGIGWSQPPGLINSIGFALR